jgi:hypothetical protein
MVGQPDTDRFFSYPSCAFTIANYLAFRVFGFSHFVTVGFDLAVHFLLTTIGAVLIWQVTRRSDLAAIFVFCTLQILMPLGRPEEFALSIATLALIAVEHWPNRVGIPIVLLGITGITSPGTAVVGTVLVLAYARFRELWPFRFVRNAALVIVLAPAVSALLYTAFFWPLVTAAIQQHWHLDRTGVYSRATLLNLLVHAPEAMISPLLLSLTTVVTAIVGRGLRRDWFPRQSAAGAFVAAAAIAVCVGLALNIVVRRLAYDYRHMTYIGAAATLIAMSWLPSATTWRSRARYAGLVVGWCALALIPLRDLGRYTLSPLTWSDDSASFAAARQRLNDLAAPSESVGGDGSLWAMVDDGRPYYATTHCYDLSKLPDVLVSARWANPPAQLWHPEIAAELAANYTEIDVFPEAAPGGTYLNVFGVRLPIARGSSDWSFRAWRRRSLPPATSVE